MGCAREVSASFTAYFETDQHTTAAHGWTRFGFILIFSSFLLFYLQPSEGKDPLPWVIERVAPTLPPLSESIIMADRVSATRSTEIFPSDSVPKGRGGSSRGQRGGGPGNSSRGGGRHHGPQGPQPTMDKPKREAILDLSKYVNEKIRVKFTGGREGACAVTSPPRATRRCSW